MQVGVWERILEQFVNDGMEAGKRTNARQRRQFLGTKQSAQRGQQKSGLDHWQWNLLLVEPLSPGLIGRVVADRRVRQVEIQVEYGGGKGNIGDDLEDPLRSAAFSSSASRMR